MGTAEDRIEVNDGGIVWNRLNNPHSCILIRRISNMVIPFNQRTWVFDVIMSERKKEADTANVQASHSVNFLVGADQYGVIARWPTSP